MKKIGELLLAVMLSMLIFATLLIAGLFLILTIISWVRDV